MSIIFPHFRESPPKVSLPVGAPQFENRFPFLLKSHRLRLLKFSLRFAMSRTSTDSSSFSLSDGLSGADNTVGELLQSSQSADEMHSASYHAALNRNRELIKAAHAVTTKQIGKCQDDIKRVAEYTARKDVRRKAHLQRHEGLHEETIGRVDQHAEHLEDHGDRLEDHGDRLEALEKGHKSMTPALWALGAAGATVLAGALIWGATKIFGKKKKETRRESKAVVSDDETDDEEEDKPVGHRRARDRRVHSRAWRIAPELRGGMWSEDN